MDSAGLDRETGAPLADFPHVEQCVHRILTARLGSMIMLREFGSGAPGLLGRKMSAKLIGAFFALIATAIETWEPRFRVVKVTPVGNTATTVATGRFGFRVTGLYRPRALSGDFTPESGLRTIDF